MRKILCVTDCVYLGGGEIVLLDLIRELKKRDFDAILVIPKTGPIEYEARRRSIDVILIDMPPTGKGSIRHPLIFLKSVIKFVNLIKDKRISYIFANNLNAGIYASIAAKPFGIQTLWYCWGSYFPKDNFWQYAYRFLFNRIAFCSFFVKERMKIKSFKQNDLPVIYPGVNISRFDGDNSYFENLFKKTNGIPDDFHIFSIIGRLDICKNHLMFLKVADEMARRNPKTYFVIAGGLSEDEGGNNKLKEELEEKIRNTPSLKGRVIFTGFLRDVERIIKASKIIFSCTGDKKFGESFGLTIVESMVSGRAVIAVSVGGPVEIISEGFNGFLVKPGDYESMALKALDLIGSHQRYDMVVNNARKEAVRKYCIERFAEDILSVYARSKNEEIA